MSENQRFRFPPFRGRGQALVRRYALWFSVLLLLGIFVYIIAEYFSLHTGASEQWQKDKLKTSREIAQKLSNRIDGEFNLLEGLGLGGVNLNSDSAQQAMAQRLLERERYHAVSLSVETADGRRRTVWPRQGAPRYDTIPRAKENAIYQRIRSQPAPMLLPPYRDTIYADSATVISIAMAYTDARGALSAVMVVDYLLGDFLELLSIDERTLGLVVPVAGRESFYYAFADNFYIHPGFDAEPLLQSESVPLDIPEPDSSLLHSGDRRSIAYTRLKFLTPVDATDAWMVVSVVPNFSGQIGAGEPISKMVLLIAMVSVLFGMLLFWRRVATREQQRLQAIEEISGLYASGSVYARPTMAAVAAILQRFVPLESLGIGILRPGQRVLEYLLVFEDGEFKTLSASETGPLRVNLDAPEYADTPSRRCIDSGRALHVPDFAAYLAGHPGTTAQAQGKTARSAVFLPLRDERSAQAPVTGVLSVQTLSRPHTYTVQEAEFLAKFGKLTELALKKEEALRETLATRDLLFSLLSHHVLALLVPVTTAFQRLQGEDVQASSELKPVLESVGQLKKVLDIVKPWMKSEMRIIPLDPVRMDLARLVDKSITVFGRQAAQRDISVESGVARGSMIVVDAGLFQLILGNLIINAIMYNKDGGQVKVTTEKQADGWVVGVSDTGIGMPPEVLAELFLQKRTLQKAALGTESQGLGLGLYICAQLLRRMGGRFLPVESAVGEGSVFRFFLPHQQPLNGHP